MYIRSQYGLSLFNAINDFDLIKDGDKIAIGVSGGKDSLLSVKLFQKLKKIKVEILNSK